MFLYLMRWGVQAGWGQPSTQPAGKEMIQSAFSYSCPYGRCQTQLCQGAGPGLAILLGGPYVLVPVQELWELSGIRQRPGMQTTPWVHPPASPGRGGLGFLMGVVVPHLRKYQKVGWPKPRGHVVLFSSTLFCLVEMSLVEMAANFPLNFPFSP